MTASIKINPPNSLLFISDLDGGTTPKITRVDRMWSTPSCIAVGCLMEQDGPTEITIGDAREIADMRHDPAFDGFIETPSCEVIVSTSENVTVLQMAVQSTHTRIRIWLNRMVEPDEIVIGVD